MSVFLRKRVIKNEPSANLQPRGSGFSSLDFLDDCSVSANDEQLYLSSVEIRVPEFHSRGGGLPYMDYIGMAAPKCRVSRPFWS